VMIFTKFTPCRRVLVKKFYSEFRGKLKNGVSLVLDHKQRDDFNFSQKMSFFYVVKKI
jgi:hypothetical protein